MAMDILGDQADAQDAVQQALADVARHKHVHANQEIDFPYVARAVHNRCVTQLRTSKNQQIVVPLFAVQELIVDDSADSDWEEREAAKQQEAARKVLNRCIEGLPPKRREVARWVLGWLKRQSDKELKDIPWDRVGAKLGMAPETARKHWALAKRNLRTLMKAWWKDQNNEKW